MVSDSKTPTLCLSEKQAFETLYRYLEMTAVQLQEIDCRLQIVEAAIAAGRETRVARDTARWGVGPSTPSPDTQRQLAALREAIERLST